MMGTCTSASEVKSMRTVLFNSAVILGVIWMGTAPADAAPPSMSGIGETSIQVDTGERVGYRRYYRRYGYPVPYAYYPPPYGYYVAPPAYVYPPRTSVSRGLRLRTTAMSVLHRTATTATPHRTHATHMPHLTPITPTLHLTAIPPTLRRTATTATLHRMAITPTLHRLATTPTLGPRRVINRSRSLSWRKILQRHFTRPLQPSV